MHTLLVCKRVSTHVCASLRMPGSARRAVACWEGGKQAGWVRMPTWRACSTLTSRPADITQVLEPSAAGNGAPESHEQAERLVRACVAAAHEVAARGVLLRITFETLFEYLAVRAGQRSGLWVLLQGLESLCAGVHHQHVARRWRHCWTTFLPGTGALQGQPVSTTMFVCCVRSLACNPAPAHSC